LGALHESKEPGTTVGIIFIFLILFFEFSCQSMGIDANSRGLGSLKIGKIFGDLKMTG
jgi:hypothetical protein